MTKGTRWAWRVGVIGTAVLGLLCALGGCGGGKSGREGRGNESSGAAIMHLRVDAESASVAVIGDHHELELSKARVVRVSVTDGNGRPVPSRVRSIADSKVGPMLIVECATGEGAGGSIAIAATVEYKGQSYKLAAEYRQQVGGGNLSWEPVREALDPTDGNSAPRE